MAVLIASDEDALFHYINSMSHKLVRLAEIYVYLLDHSSKLTTDERAALKRIGKSLRTMQRAVSNLTTVQLKNNTTELRDARSELDKVLARLEKIVEAVNQLNELLEIAGELAAIAAGIAA